MKIKIRNKTYRVTDIFLYILIFLFTAITLAALIWVLVYILANGLPHVNWQFLTTEYGSKSDGILPMIKTTFLLVFVAIATAAPIGIASAIFLVEYAKDGILLKIIRFTTETLAGIPSIIFGLFGYIFFVIICDLKFSIISGALTLCIMVLPTIIRTTEEALKTVPISYKEGSLALGANKVRTIFKVILPCAIPGILTSVILSIGRIVGESAAVMLTAGTALVATQSIGLMRSGRSLTVHLYLLAKEGAPLAQSLATASVLIIIIALLNFIASAIAKTLTKKTT